jgi:hypothetical protein
MILNGECLLKCGKYGILSRGRAKKTGTGVETFDPSRKTMSEHYDKANCPFKVGQLVRLHVGEPWIGIYLVLKIEWDSYHSEWWVHVFCQQSGKLHWRPAKRFEIAEKKDE